MAGDGAYCSFAKAVEHLGDRWSLVIVRELLRYGTRGFNDLADGLPGISRSVLAQRLRKLQQLGLIERAGGAARGRSGGYRLTAAGRDLDPALRSLWQWSLRWLPEDPALAETDPDIVVAWLGQRFERERLPVDRAVLQVDLAGSRARRFWLVLARGEAPSACLEDPHLSEDRYVYLEADVRGLSPLARGQGSWRAALGDGSLAVFGAPDLVRALPTWFPGP